jgi:hypothetical protein
MGACSHCTYKQYGFRCQQATSGLQIRPTDELRKSLTDAFRRNANSVTKTEMD